MPQTTGHVQSIAINETRLTFKVFEKLEPPQVGRLVRCVLYEDAPGTHTIPQVELARRSWMLSMVQSSFLHNKGLEVTHNDDGLVTALRLQPMLVHIDSIDGIAHPFPQPLG